LTFTSRASPHYAEALDARVRIRTATGTYRWYIEVDRGTVDTAEYSRQLAKKMGRYIAAWPHRPTRLFPIVLFTVRNPERQRFIEGVVKRQTLPQMFRVVLFDEAITLLSR
jgi:hypothetical protein